MRQEGWARWVGKLSRHWEAWAVAGLGSWGGLERQVCAGVDDKKQG